MKLPSIQSLWQSAAAVVVRFPLQVLIAVVAVVLWWNLPGHHNDYTENQLVKALFVCNFALTLLLSADLFSEARQYTAGKKWVLRVIALALAGNLYFALDPFCTSIRYLAHWHAGFCLSFIGGFCTFYWQIKSEWLLAVQQNSVPTGAYIGFLLGRIVCGLGHRTVCH